VTKVLTPTLLSGGIGVMDYPGAHKVDGIEVVIQARGAPLLYVAPYSPAWSPIAPCRVKLKTYVRGVKARTRAALDQALACTIGLITASDARSWFKHCDYSLQSLANRSRCSRAGEPITSSLLIGMLLIFASFGLLIRQSLADAANSKTGAPHRARSWMTTLASLGYFYGPVSALAYATGYVVRKQGLIVVPDPAFGTMPGSMVGAVCFVVAVQFVDSYRSSLRNALTTFNPWLFVAGTLWSVGQLLYFAALSYSTISRVPLIPSWRYSLRCFSRCYCFGRANSANS
jgi:uncharacterized membrane protein